MFFFSRRVIKMKWINNLIVTLIVIYVGNRCIDIVLYEHYMSQGDKLRAWLIRPIYGFKMFWVD